MTMSIFVDFEMNDDKIAGLKSFTMTVELILIKPTLFLSSFFHKHVPCRVTFQGLLNATPGNVHQFNTFLPQSSHYSVLSQVALPHLAQ